MEDVSSHATCKEEIEAIYGTKPMNSATGTSCVAEEREEDYVQPTALEMFVLPSGSRSPYSSHPLSVAYRNQLSENALVIGQDAELPWRFKVAILGHGNVGKSSLLRRLSGERPENDYDMFNENDFRGCRLVSVGVSVPSLFPCTAQRPQPIRIQLWDSAGIERYASIVRSSCSGAQGFILCYSVRDRESFERIQLWRELLGLNLTSDQAFVLVGLQADSNIDNEDVDLLKKGSHRKPRAVSHKEGAAVALKLGCAFFECSAIDNLRTDDMLAALMYRILKAWSSCIQDQDSSLQLQTPKCQLI